MGAIAVGGEQTGGAGAVRFLRLGHQCPFADRFSSEAAKLASALDLPFVEQDITGHPDVAAPVGAYHSMQVDVPGHPLLAAPQDAGTMARELRQSWPDRPCSLAAVEPSTGASGVCVALVRPGQDPWPEAVSATVRLCVPPSVAGVDRKAAAEAKRAWLESLHLRHRRPGVALLVAYVDGDPRGFVELIPAAAAHVPLPTAGAGDLFLTCIHARGEAGDLRPQLLTGLVRFAAAGAPRMRVWAVVGLRRCYPNGPWPLFDGAGFIHVGGLGKVYLPDHGWDELALACRCHAAVDAGAAGLVLAAQDNVATIPGGCRAGGAVLLSGGGTRAASEALTAIPPGHKIALALIPKGGDVVKYGQSIGVATCDIHPGEWVHVHNVASDRAGGRAACRRDRAGGACCG